MNSEKEGEKSQRRESLITWLYELIFVYSERSYIYIYIVFQSSPLNFKEDSKFCIRKCKMCKERGDEKHRSNS